MATLINSIPLTITPSKTTVLPTKSTLSHTLKLTTFPTLQLPHFLKFQRHCFLFNNHIWVEEEVLPPILDAASDPPPVFDGTTRLYISYTCPYAQRAWITRNCKGLQDRIKLMPIDLKNRPAWYKEKVYPLGKVPSLEHNNEVRGENLDLIKFIDKNFEGPSLLPDEPDKQKFSEVLFSQTDSFQKSVTASFKVEGVTEETNAAFDYIEDALSKFDDGPFFLGQFSLVDVAYIPFIERYKAYLLDVKTYDLTEGRPTLAAWIQEMNKIEGYKQTQSDPKLLIEGYKKRFLNKPRKHGGSNKRIAELIKGLSRGERNGSVQI